MINNRTLNISEVNENNECFVFATINNTRVYSCYFSPNMTTTKFAESLNNLEASIRSTKHNVVIGGDFNSKSPEWHSSTLDKKGTITSEIIASLGLMVFNVGDKLTFRRGTGGSIIDITFGTTTLYNAEMNWKVLEDFTLSDHQYISFNIGDYSDTNNREIELPRWNVKKLDEKKLREYITREKSKNSNNTILNSEESVQVFTEILTKACNIAMPKIQKYNGKNPVYWWTEEIRDLRTKCLAARRKSTRHPGIEVVLHEYREARKTLRKAIKNSKKRSWKALCDEVDADPWGKPYKIAMKRLGAIKPIPGIKNPDWAKQIVKTLFPFDIDGLTKAEQVQNEDFEPITVEELQQAANKLNTGKSPGPDGIPNEVIKVACEIWSEPILKIFNTCLSNGIFPTKWKTQRLVLLRKQNKPLNEPSSSRPLCMLDSLGKVLENLLLKRLEANMESLGGLSPMQFGFLKGKSTVDAITKVVHEAMHAKATGEYCAVITLDVKNAFNTVKWRIVIEALKTKGITNYLCNIIADYLDNRTLLYETESGLKKYRITAGVPQGSILGPYLWNVMYDGLLNINLQDGAKLVGYADDIALVIKQRTTELIEIIGNHSLCQCSRWLRRNGLQLAVPKTEAILVTSRRVFVTPKLRLQEIDISFKRSLGYLGVQLDDKLRFAQHVRNIRDKGLRTASSLAKIMPNYGGPKPYIRKLINSVVHAQLLYAAPTFTGALNLKYNIRELQKPQRLCALRIISAYRTVSTGAALVLADLPPIDLLILEKEEIYTNSKRIDDETNDNERRRKIYEIRENARNRVIEKWQERWDRAETGRWTYVLIPNIRTWIMRKHGYMGYFLTQIMTDHGNFNKYLYRFKIKNTSGCDSCGALEEDAKHVLFECEKWSTERRTLYSRLGETLTPENMVNIMLRHADAWKLCENYINETLKERCTVTPNLLT